MIEFQYMIDDRGLNVVEATRYAGHVTAANPKDGLLAALVAEFGDKDESKPLINQLCDSGWIDPEIVSSHIDGLAVNATYFCLGVGDRTFDVEVCEIEGNPPHDYIDGAGDA